MSAQKEEFIVSARKYRPTAWDEVVGQEAITDTLRQSIEQGHLAHAYLFCGPRGVGKTTCARIFAKEINKGDKHLDEDFSFNVFELDAASNNKVDDIRNLTDQVRIPPQVGKYKVYIIDEVHMLSAQAFNAFLKTLEEPPKHAIFILATTEKHKIIPTILSRCQIYDFNRITVEEIVKHLRAITDKEKIEAEDDALHVIAQKADGALRDALSIFDQLSSFTNRKLTYEAVLKNLHVLDYDYYFKLVGQLSAGDYSSALLLLDEVLKLGFDASHFISGLGAHLRDLLVCQNPKTIALLEVGEAVKKQYHTQAQAVEAFWLLAALKECQQCEFRVRASMNQRLLLEVTLLTIASLGAEKKNHSSELSVSPPKVITEPKKPAAQEKPQVQATITKQVSQLTQTPQSLVSAEKPAAPVRKRTISLSDIDNEYDAPAPSPQALDSTVAQVSDNTHTLPFAEAWQKIADTYQQKGLNALHSILKRQDTNAMMTGSTVRVTLMHGVEEEELNQHRTDVLELLRSFSGDRNLQLTTEITAQHTEAKLFGARDKFEHLAKKNPAIIKLKQDLDLDFS